MRACITRSIDLHKQVEFEGGKAVIKATSKFLMEQIRVAIKAIAQTTEEFEVPPMHFRIEGHTSYSKKSPDGGIGTSNARAKAVMSDLSRGGVPKQILHPVGHGCSMPLTKNARDAANRRVEIHVMDAQQAQLMKDRQEAKARKARSAGGGYLAPIKR